MIGLQNAVVLVILWSRRISYLSARVLKAGARVIGHTGKILTDQSIGLRVAMRDLKQHPQNALEDEKGTNKVFFRVDSKKSFLLRTIQEQSIAGARNGASQITCQMHFWYRFSLQSLNNWPGQQAPIARHKRHPRPPPAFFTA